MKAKRSSRFELVDVENALWRKSVTSFNQSKLLSLPTLLCSQSFAEFASKSLITFAQARFHSDMISHHVIIGYPSHQVNFAEDAW